MLACLADDRRRAALAVLADADGAPSREDLAVAVAAREADGEPTHERVRSVLASLQHVHLPKLREAGLVARDADDGTVTYLGHPELDAERVAAGPSDQSNVSSTATGN